MLTRSMAFDFGSDGIRANAAAPGIIDKLTALMDDGIHEHKIQNCRTLCIVAGRIPLPRSGRPEDCAGAFVFLLFKLSQCVTGLAMCIGGGRSGIY